MSRRKRREKKLSAQSQARLDQANDQQARDELQDVFLEMWAAQDAAAAARYPERPAPTSAEAFRQQFEEVLLDMWVHEWSCRTEGDGLRWFRHAWRDTRRILHDHPPAEGEELQAYAARIRQALEGIHFRYAGDDLDEDGYLDEDNWYTAIIHTILATLDRMV
ncbi:hypothetical protein [Candidatus Chloroploca sp. Khr17]|uniref:hypothetical protein n=1 Tax=Candidatus Chloroploca sp. Khr17 TaxID=2496869 RepID=UPI00101C60FD|nr:hypothetical protein [Candidatus Chloroploca sp. Khr17]